METVNRAKAEQDRKDALDREKRKVAGLPDVAATSKIPAGRSVGNALLGAEGGACADGEVGGSTPMASQIQKPEGLVVLDEGGRAPAWLLQWFIQDQSA